MFFRHVGKRKDHLNKITLDRIVFIDIVVINYILLSVFDARREVLEVINVVMVC